MADPRITFVHGDGRRLQGTLTPEVVGNLPHPWLVVEDADHSYQTTFAVMKFFAPHLKCGDYLVVEDGLCDTMGNAEKYDGGPNRAIDEFCELFPEIYELDGEYCDFFGNNVTWCTNGWLRRSDAPWNEEMTR